MLHMVALMAGLITATLVGCGQESGRAGPNPETLMDPNTPEMTQTAPGQFKVRMETTAGTFVIEVLRAWAPHGADRFYNLVQAGYYDETRFFRVVPNFIVQWGMHGDPEVTAAWRSARIADDPVVESNVRGTVTFAKTSAPNSRTTQLFINLKDNANLDRTGFAPFGRVVEGMEVVDAINPEYGQRPDQDKISEQGNEYLVKAFPNLTYTRKATVVE